MLLYLLFQERTCTVTLEKYILREPYNTNTLHYKGVENTLVILGKQPVSYIVYSFSFTSLRGFNA